MFIYFHVLFLKYSIFSLRLIRKECSFTVGRFAWRFGMCLDCRSDDKGRPLWWPNLVGRVPSCSSSNSVARGRNSQSLGGWVVQHEGPQNHPNEIKPGTLSGWWFGTFFIFPYSGNNHPDLLIFFIGVQTTNQSKWDKTRYAILHCGLWEPNWGAKWYSRNSSLLNSIFPQRITFGPCVQEQQAVSAREEQSILTGQILS